MVPKIKICGLTREEDVESAIRLGADLLGFVLVAASPRRVEKPRLAELVRLVRGRVPVVGVVAGMSAAEINGMLEEIPLTLIQLHGDEPPGFEAAIRRPCLRARPMTDPADLAALAKYGRDTFLLDGRRDGGTRRFCDWSLAREAAAHYRIWLAGGISAANAVGAIREVNPWGVDVSSSLETVPGVKSEKKMIEFFQTIRGER